MEYRSLGSTGIELSALGFGCGQQGGLFVAGRRSEQLEAAKRAIDAGVNYFDTAASYGNGSSEENLGEVLNELGADVYVGTKVGLLVDELDDADRLIPERLRAGLQRLGRNEVDVCHLHSRVRSGAPAGRFVAAIDICEEVAAAMQSLKDEGLTRAIGFTAIGDTDALKQVVKSGKFDTMQSYFGVLNPSAGSRGTPLGPQQEFDHLMVDAAERDMGIFAIRIYGAGAIAGDAPRHPLAGNLASSSPTHVGDIVEAKRLAKLASDFGLESAFEIATRFVLSEPLLTTALGGFSDSLQLADALRWIERGPLPDEVLSALHTV